MKLIHALMPLLGLAALTACTGTPEGLPAIRLIVQEGSGVGADLRVIDPGDGSSAVRESAPITPPDPAASGGVVGIATLAGINRLAVAFSSRVDVFQVNDPTQMDNGAGISLQLVATLPTPQRTSDGASLIPCYTGMRADETRTLLVLLSACAGQAQQVVVLNSSSTDPTASWWRDLPAPYADPAQTLFAVSGGTVTVARPNPSAGSDVFRGARDNTPGVTLPLRYTSAFIRDLANYRGTVYAATDDAAQGVRLVNNDALGSAFLVPRSTRLFPDGDLLSSWNDGTTTLPPNNQLVFARGSVNNAANPQSQYGIPGVVGVAAPPDGYAYVVNNSSNTGSIVRYDVLVGLSSPNNSFNSTTLLLPTPLNNPQGVAWVIPPGVQ